MNVLMRGVKNAFRNGVRTGSVVLILAIGIGLALSMLVANQAVDGRINQLKTEMGTTLTINPAGTMGFEGGGASLTNDDVETVEDVANIVDVNATLSMRVQPEGTEGMGMQSPNTISLQAAIEPDSEGMKLRLAPGMTLPENFSIPINITGISGTTSASGTAIEITDGRNFTADDADENVALVGIDLAEKNNLDVGSTFTINEDEITVVGIFDQDTKFDNGSLYLPLETTQRLGGFDDEVLAILAQVDSIDNLQSAKEAVQEALGEDKADVTSAQQDIEAAISGLESVKTISIVGFVAALVAAGAIIFMVMIMIVRERRREIGVLKAIGASNFTVIKQFMVEAMVLIVLGSVVGVGIAYAGSSSIANALVDSNTSQSAEEPAPGGAMKGGMMMRGGTGGQLNAKSIETTNDLVGEVTASIGAGTLASGLLAAIAIAIVGSALPAWFIAKIRPVEVLRGE